MRRNSSSRNNNHVMNIELFEIINGILTILLVILGSLVIWTMLKYDFLNFRGINYGVIVVIILAIVLSVFLVIKKKAKIFNAIMLIIINITLVFSYMQFRTAIGLFDNLNSNATVSEYTMSVVVMKNDTVEKLSDLNSASVAAPVSTDGENINKLMKEIRDKEKQSLNLTESKNYISAYEELTTGTSRAMILNSSFEDLITSQHADFKEKTKKIYEYKITKTVSTKAKQNVGDTFNVYISGIDTFGPVSSVSRSDVNIIMTVNKKTGRILLTTTPRDSYVKIADGGNNQYDKLTHAGLYGVDSSIHTLENLYGIKIDYYARLNFTSFLKLIDIVGGVDVYNDQTFTSLYGKYSFTPGLVHLNADKALGFVRERYSLTGGANDRGTNQEKVITAIIKKLTSKEGLSNYQSIIKELSQSIQTNMPIETALGLANEQLGAGKDYNVASQALTGTGSMELPSYAMPGARLYMTQINEQSLREVTENIKEVLEGK